MKPQLELIGVTKKFRHLDYEQTVLHQISLNLDPGSFLTVVGGNGAGKSTLLNILGGALAADAGEFKYEGTSVTHPKSMKSLQKGLARVYQDPSRGTAGQLTVLENLCLADRSQGSFGLQLAVTPQKRKVFAEHVSSLGMGLEDQLDHAAKRLSGGQRQALALLMAHLRRPRVLLLDEHTAALDPKVSETVMALTERLSKSHQVTTVMITHSLREALAFGDRLIVLSEGRIHKELQGEGKRRMTPEGLRQCFI